MTTAVLPVLDGELVLPDPVGKQAEWLDSGKSRKLMRVGRRGTKTRFAFIAAIAGHGPGWDEGTPSMPGILQSGDVVWIAQDYPNLKRVVWREEIKPRFEHLPWAHLNELDHALTLDGLGTLFLASAEAIKGIRGMGKNIRGIIVDEAAWLALRSALLDVVLPILLDNDGWLIIMSTTNAGPDGGYDDTGAPQTPSYFNLLSAEIQDGKRSDDWVEFYATAYDNPTLSKQAIDELVAEYPPGSPQLKQEVFAEVLETGVGLALPGLSEATHMVPAFSPPSHWTRWASFDWGYHHPWSFGDYVCDEDGQVYGRDSLTGRLDLPQQIDAKVRAYGINPNTIDIYAGPDVWRTRVSEKGKIKGEYTGPTVAEQLQNLGWRLIPAADARVAGLNNMRQYLHIDPLRPETRPRFLWMDTPENKATLAQVAKMPLDPDKPEDALKVDADAAGRGGDDKYDRCLAGDTMVRIEEGVVSISRLVGTSGKVLTPMGWLRYNGVRQTAPNADLWRVSFASGAYVDATASHEFLTTIGWRPLGSFVNGTTVSGEVVLAHEERLLPAPDAMAAPRSVDSSSRSDREGNRGSPSGRQSGEQRAFQSRRDPDSATPSWALDHHRARSGGGAYARQAGEFAGHSDGGSGMASDRSGSGVGIEERESQLDARHLSDYELRAMRAIVQDSGDAAHNQVLPRELQGQGITCSATRVTGVVYLGQAPVYNMEVEQAHCFVVQGGVVVHNCRYGLMARPILAIAPKAEDRQGQSLGFDFERNQPRERETGEQAMQKLIGLPVDARAGRYRVPVRRG